MHVFKVLWDNTELSIPLCVFNDYDCLLNLYPIISFFYEYLIDFF